MRLESLSGCFGSRKLLTCTYCTSAHRLVGIHVWNLHNKQENLHQSGLQNDLQDVYTEAVQSRNAFLKDFPWKNGCDFKMLLMHYACIAITRNSCLKFLDPPLIMLHLVLFMEPIKALSGIELLIFRGVTEPRGWGSRSLLPSLLSLAWLWAVVCTKLLLLC